MQFNLKPTVGARFKRARFPVKIDPIIQPGALETCLYRADPPRIANPLSERSGQVETWSHRIFQNKWPIWIHPEGKNRTEDE